ncbi:MAG: spore germination protein [Clostridia bacterium]|nr:spore germination protein [Lachnospiraceae bacterium]NCB99587.1 spore germination protein [Clostridia bacterium]NCD01791.1 spore germination protein [Clostridia bacterium]
MKISEKLDENIKELGKWFENCEDIVKKKMMAAGLPIYIVYVDSMIDRDLVEGEFLKNIMYGLGEMPDKNVLTFLQTRALTTADTKIAETLEDAVLPVLSGDTAIFIEGCNNVLLISSKKFPSRGVQSAESEVALRGAKDSFTESMRTNTILIRRRIRDIRLKTLQRKVGVRSQTDITIMYMEGIARPELVQKIEKRLESFKVDGIFDSGSLEQLTEKRWYSPFPQFQSTERPDKAASALLEGRIVVNVDNSPMVLLLPTTLNCFFQAADDYYNRWGIVCFVRLLRYVAALIAMVLPAFYIGVACFHPEMLPTSLELSFAAAREGVPFPLPVEVLILELAFELLREAGIRLPGPMGSALGIVGGLIIGQAAVDANIVSPIVVIVVALTALASFTIPNEGFASAFRLVKFYLILLASFLGVYGVILGMLTVLIHLASLESFGIPYLMPYVAVRADGNMDLQDGLVRKPLFKLKKRPVFAQKEQRIRYKSEEDDNVFK